MAWFKVDDGFHSSRKLLRIPKRTRWAAAGLWAVAGSWSADQLTDGHVPNYMLNEWGAPPAAPESLVDAGLWERASDGYVFYNWHEYQPRKEDVDAERAASRARMRDLRAKRKQPKPLEQAEQGQAFGRTGPNRSESVRNPDPVPTRPDPTQSRPSNKEEAKASSSEPERPDVERVINSFSELLKANDIKHKPGQTWRTAARLLIDRDGYTPDQILYVARYATADEFWKSNILSLPKLREKFEALKIKAQAANNPQPQRMDRSAMLRAKEADMLARFNAAQEQPLLQIED